MRMLTHDTVRSCETWRACSGVQAHPEVPVLGLDAAAGSRQPLCQQEFQHLQATWQQVSQPGRVQQWQHASGSIQPCVRLPQHSTSHIAHDSTAHCTLHAAHCTLHTALHTAVHCTLHTALHTALHCTALHCIAPHSTLHSTSHHSAAEHIAAQHSTAKNSSAQDSTAQHSTSSHSTAGTWERNSCGKHAACLHSIHIQHTLVVYVPDTYAAEIINLSPVAPQAGHHPDMSVGGSVEHGRHPSLCPHATSATAAEFLSVHQVPCGRKVQMHAQCCRRMRSSRAGVSSLG
jgi:hypothetical protein